MSKHRDAKGRFTSPPSPAVRRGHRPSRDVEFSRKPGHYAALGYESATIATREGRSSIQASDERHTSFDRAKLLGQARAFYNNNALYRGMIDRAAQYIVGTGFKLNARTGDAKLDKEIERIWKRFWRRPEVKQTLTGSGTELMLAKELLCVGDTGMLHTTAGLVQLIEAEQIAGDSKHRDGIRKNKNGTPTSFYISPYGRGGRVDPKAARNVRTRDFCFLCKPSRPSSTRAVPPCQASFAMLHRINDVCDSEAIAWQLLARIAVSINRKNAGEQIFNQTKADPNISDTEGKAAPRITELGYALIFNAEDGEEIKGVDRNIPGSNFTQSLTMFLRLLGLPLGLPLEIVLLDWSQSNYSQSRAVLVQAFQAFLAWQELLEEFGMRPTLEWRIRAAIADGELPDIPSIYDHEWIKPTFPWIDQLKEALAYGTQLDRSMVTHAQVCKSRNLDSGDIIAARESEIRQAIEIARKLEAEFPGVKVPWEPFAGLKPTSAGRPAGAAPATSSLTPADPNKQTDDGDSK